MRLVHIPKTAGNTLAPLFDTVIDHDIKREGYKHLKDLPSEEYTVAVVRDPFDRFVSAYFYLSEGSLNEQDQRDSDKYIKGKDFVTFTKEATPEIFEQIHFRPQYQWLEGGHVDAIMRFEDLPKDLPRTNTSMRREAKHYNRGNALEKVKELYAKDYDLFY